MSTFSTFALPPVRPKSIAMAKIEELAIGPGARGRSA